MKTHNNKHKLEVNPELANLSLHELLRKFDVNRFQDFLLISSVRFQKPAKTYHVDLATDTSFDVTFWEHKEFFVRKTKRKDDMMSSLLKFIQRILLREFKDSRSAQLVRDSKRAFRACYFSNHRRTESVFYSNLFNRKQLSILCENPKLIKHIRETFREETLELLVHDYFLGRQANRFFEPFSEFVFSSNFVKSLSKKQMTLQDALFSFYSIEKYLGESYDLRESESESKSSN